MKSGIPGLLVAVLLAGPMAAGAVEVESSTTVNLTFRDCMAGTSVCDGVSSPINNTYAGLPGDTTAQADETDAEYGTAGGSAALADGTLRASATSLPLKRNGGNGGSLQRYTYMGSVPTTLTFGATLTYEQTVPAENASFLVKSGATADIIIYTTSNELIDAGNTQQSNFRAVWLLDLPPGFSNLGHVSTGNPSNVTESGTRTLSIPVNVNPGDQIWLGASVQSLAANGAAVAATLVTNLSPIYSCAGFEAPANEDLVVRKQNRVLPLRMALLDDEGIAVSAIAPPVVNVSYTTLGGVPGTSDELVYIGKGDDGNQFVFNGSKWAFNLKTKGLADGRYTFTAVSGDPAYAISPTCEVSVDIQ